MKIHEFFLVALPGLEDLVASEVQDWFPELDFKTEFGGVTIMAPIEQGLSMNRVLKTPTRILLRVSHFKCRDFPKLFNKVKSINWSQWLNENYDLSAQATARLSRLNMKTRLEKTCLDGFQHYKKEKGLPKGKSKIDLYIRLHKDDCTLSLDTSGQRLHKRRVQKHIGKAPLRESIAASLILMTEKYAHSQNTIEVVDPMMGSGTFLLEAMQLRKPLDQRDFNFEAFRSPDVITPRCQVSRPYVTKCIGYELDPKACAAAETNGVQNILNEDFFKASSLPKTSNQRWLFCNPPYGERLKVNKALSKFYAELFAQCEKVVAPHLACFLLPTKAVKGKFNLPPGWKVLEKRAFLNGGLPVTAFVFGRNLS